MSLDLISPRLLRYCRRFNIPAGKPDARGVASACDPTGALLAGDDLKMSGEERGAL